MKFKITHSTLYQYDSPVSESFGEIRIFPQSNHALRLLNSSLAISPKTHVDHYTDHLQNRVGFYSILHRHQRLRVTAHSTVETIPYLPPPQALEVSIAEALQIYQSQMLHLYLFLKPTPMVPLRIHPDKETFRQTFARKNNLFESALALNQWIHKNFQYAPQSTSIATPLEQVAIQKKGVCQDFAHLMLSVLRSNNIPCRYVSGYIEATDPTKPNSKLIGAEASHAWVEILLPGHHWIGLDPTNNQVVGERHIPVAYGRDYSDISPLKGIYKGIANQHLTVSVQVKRL